MSTIDFGACHFETERLTTASWHSSLADTANKLRLKGELGTLLTPAVLKHLPPPMQPGTGPNALDCWIAARDRESYVLCIRKRGSNSFIGLLILATFPEADGSTTVRIGYFLNEQSWGKGYATELVKGLINWCKDQKMPMQILGGVEKANPASAAVLKKLDFKIELTMSTNETETYQLTV